MKPSIAIGDVVEVVKESDPFHGLDGDVVGFQEELFGHWLIVRFDIGQTIFQEHEVQKVANQKSIRLRSV